MPSSAGQCQLWTWILKHYVDDVEVFQYEKPDLKYLNIGLSNPSSIGIMMTSKICIVYFSVELLSIDFTKSLRDKSMRYEISIHTVTNQGLISSWDVQRSHSEFVNFKKDIYKADPHLYNNLVHFKLPKPLTKNVFDEEIEKHLSECEKFLFSILSIPSYRKLDATHEFFYITMARTSTKLKKITSEPVLRKSKQRFSTVHSVEMPRRRRVMSIAENL